MKRFDRALCIASSFVPAVAVWLSFRRYQEFVSAFENLLSFTPILVTSFVVATIRFWPLLVVVGWLLLIPAMSAKPWARRLRIVLMCSYVILGPLLYAICLEGLFDPAMRVSKAVLQPKESTRQPGVGR